MLKYGWQHINDCSLDHLASEYCIKEIKSYEAMFGKPCCITMEYVLVELEYLDRYFKTKPILNKNATQDMIRIADHNFYYGVI